MRVMTLNERAKVPTRGSALAAGFDLYASERRMLYVGDRVAVPTGIAVAIEPGWYGRIAPRSGLAARHGIDVLAGVIDSDYRGEVGVLLLNTGIEDVEIGQGSRIAQLVLESCWMGEPKAVLSLDGTERGAGGFGSTGV